jgi:hypothetical protein
MEDRLSLLLLWYLNRNRESGKSRASVLEGIEKGTQQLWLDGVVWVLALEVHGENSRSNLSLLNLAITVFMQCTFTEGIAPDFKYTYTSD